MVDTKNSQEIQKPLTQQENKVPEAERTLNTEEVGISNRFLRDKTPDILSKDQLAEIEKKIKRIQKSESLKNSCYDYFYKKFGAKWEEEFYKQHNRNLKSNCEYLHLLTAKKYFLLGKISQLKEELEDWKKAYMKKEVVLGTEIEDFINKQGKQITADLKFYEDKLKEMQK